MGHTYSRSTTPTIKSKDQNFYRKIDRPQRINTHIPSIKGLTFNFQNDETKKIHICKLGGRKIGGEKLEVEKFEFTITQLDD